MAGIHRRVADEVYARLHERIVTGAVAPGDRLDPTEIAESFGVSRTPVREAILRLDAQGLVERQPYRGVVVTAVDAAAAEDVAAMRLQLETLAVRAALPHVRDAELVRMRKIHEELRASVEEPDAQQVFAELNREFHLTLYRAAGSPTLIRLVTELSAQADRMRLHVDVRRGPAGDDHARILAAVEARDVEEAVAATRDHIFGALRSLAPDGFEVTPDSALDVALRASGWAAPRG